MKSIKVRSIKSLKETILLSRLLGFVEGNNLYVRLSDSADQDTVEDSTEMVTSVRCGAAVRSRCYKGLNSSGSKLAGDGAEFAHLVAKKMSSFCSVNKVSFSSAQHII